MPGQTFVIVCCQPIVGLEPPVDARIGQVVDRHTVWYLVVYGEGDSFASVHLISQVDAGGSGSTSLWSQHHFYHAILLVHHCVVGYVDVRQRIGTRDEGFDLHAPAGDGVHGRELWKSDGTASGTVMVKDIRPGEMSSEPGSSP